VQTTRFEASCRARATACGATRSLVAASRILLVDDDVELASLVRGVLTREGFDVEVVHDGATGLSRARSAEHAVVVLDLMLPAMNGLDVLRSLRTTSRLPVLMLTARGDDIDRIVGLELGADDYLPKPFNARELVARLRAILRRAEPSVGNGETLAVDDVTMNLGARLVRRGADEIALTGVEFALLELLLRAAGKTVERHVIAESVLGRRLSPFERSIDVHVSNLRRKLGPGRRGRERIQTIRGAGYVYLVEDAR
jgi:two-component system response regulator CpxR